MTPTLLLMLAIHATGDAEVRVLDSAGAPIAGATLTLVNAKAPSNANPALTSTSGADGVLTVSQGQLLMLCPPPSPCPPGAPCMRPPECAPSAIIRAKGFLEVRVNPFNAPQVRLVPDKARVVDEAAAIAAVKRDPHWKAWVGGHEYRAPVASLDHDGNWRIGVESVSWPNFLPPQSAMVDAVSAKVTLLSCPVQGSHLVVGSGGSLEDVATGYRYQCEAQEPACAGLLKPGKTLVLGSFGIARDACGPGSTAEGAFDVGTKDGPVPNVECHLTRCHRAK